MAESRPEFRWKTILVLLGFSVAAVAGTVGATDPENPWIGVLWGAAAFFFLAAIWLALFDLRARRQFERRNTDMNAWIRGQHKRIQRQQKWEARLDQMPVVKHWRQAKREVLALSTPKWSGGPSAMNTMYRSKFIVAKDRSVDGHAYGYGDPVSREEYESHRALTAQYHAVTRPDGSAVQLSIWRDLDRELGSLRCRVMAPRGSWAEAFVLDRAALPLRFPDDFEDAPESPLPPGDYGVRWDVGGLMTVTHQPVEPQLVAWDTFEVEGR